MSAVAESRILVVEDDPEIGYLLRVILESVGRDVIRVESGSDAEAAIDEGAFDLVVLDLILPDLDGRVLLRRLRERPETSTVPVIVVSARGDADIRADCLALGADAFVEKPFDPAVVERLAEVRLARSAERDRAGLIDGVTGLLSRAGLKAECDRTTSEYAVSLVQIDGFAELAERWGWEAAEAAIRSLAAVVRDVVGGGGSVGRLGGGELAIVTLDPARGAPAEVAERVLEAIRAVPVTGPDGETVNLTASIGVIEVAPETELDEAVLRARHRLFRAREAGQNQVVAGDEEADDGSRRVLVAEDDEISATILVHRLEKEGLAVRRFDNGRDAYEAALEDVPDLVILDVKMPGMDGFEVLERLRRTPAYVEVPIILLTSMGSESDVVRGFNLGADDYVLKPFSPVELSARVWRLLRKGRSPSAL